MLRVSAGQYAQLAVQAVTAAKEVDLKVGSVVKATLLEKHGDGEATVQIGGAKVRAKLEANLQPGDRVNLLVAGQTARGALELKVVGKAGSEASSSVDAASLLQALGLPELDEAKAVVREFAARGVPLRTDTVKAAVEALHQLGISKPTPEQVATIGKMAELGIPINKSTVEAMLALETGPKLHELLTRLATNLRTALPASLFAAGAGPESAPSTGQTGTAQTGTAQTGTAQTGTAQTGTAQTGTAQTGTAQTGTAQTGSVQTGTAQTTTTQTGIAQTGTAQTGTAQTGTAQTGTAQTGTAQTGTAQTGTAQTATAQTGTTQTATTQTATTQTATTQTATTQTATTQTATTQTATTQTATTQTATTQTGTAQTGTAQTGSSPDSKPAFATPGNGGLFPENEMGRPNLTGADATSRSVLSESTVRDLALLARAAEELLAAAPESDHADLADKARRLGLGLEERLAQTMRRLPTDADPEALRTAAQSALRGDLTSDGSLKSALLRVAAVADDLSAAGFPHLADDVSTLLRHVSGQQVMQTAGAERSDLFYQFTAIPLQAGGKDQTLELHVMSRKNNGQKAIDPSNCYVLFRLDLPHLGQTDIHLHIVDKVVGIRFQTAPESARIELTGGEQRELRDALQSVGFHLGVVRSETKTPPALGERLPLLPPVLTQGAVDMKI